MKMRYPLTSMDGHADVPSCWYGDVGQYQYLAILALRAMKRHKLDLVEKFWVGVGEGEGFIEPSSHPEACAVKLADDVIGTDWTFKDWYDYDDRWQGPHFRMYMENTASLYWHAKYHDAEIVMDFPVMAQKPCPAVLFRDWVRALCGLKARYLTSWLH